jgi:hypothetical protein
MPVIMNPSLLPTLATLRDLLDILAALRGAANPFGSLDGLRSAIAIVGRLGTTLQINSKWLAWLQSVADDESLLSLLLAAGQYLESLLSQPTADQHVQSATHAASDVAVELIDLANWLAIISEIMQLVAKFRGSTAPQRSASRRG